MPSSNNDATPKDFYSVTIHPKSPSTLMLLSKPGAKDTFIPAATIQAITKKKTKTSKSNKGHSIDGSIISITISLNPKHPPKIYPVSIFLLFIGASETIFEIPATFADKSYPSTRIPLGNINPVEVVSRPVASSHPTKLVAVNVLSVQPTQLWRQNHLEKKNTELMLLLLNTLLKRKNLCLVFGSYNPQTTQRFPSKPRDTMTSSLPVT